MPLMETAKLYSLTLFVRQISVNVTQGSQAQVIDKQFAHCFSHFAILVLDEFIFSTSAVGKIC